MGGANQAVDAQTTLTSSGDSCAHDFSVSAGVRAALAFKRQVNTPQTRPPPCTAHEIGNTERDQRDGKPVSRWVILGRTAPGWYLTLEIERCTNVSHCHMAVGNFKVAPVPAYAA